MVIIAVKKYCVKNGKTYGPYPKGPEIFYLYRVYRDRGQVKQQYLGKGVRPREAVVQEKTERSWRRGETPYGVAEDP